MLNHWLLPVEAGTPSPWFPGQGPLLYTWGLSCTIHHPWQSYSVHALPCVLIQLSPVLFWKHNSDFFFLFLPTQNNSGSFLKILTFCWFTSLVPAGGEDWSKCARHGILGKARAQMFPVVKFWSLKRKKKTKPSPPVITLTDCHSLLFSQS